jgi:hypothetical protein
MDDIWGTDYSNYSEHRFQRYAGLTVSDQNLLTNKRKVQIRQ